MESAIESLLGIAPQVTPELLVALDVELASRPESSQAAERRNKLLLDVCSGRDVDLIRRVASSPHVSLDVTDAEGRTCLMIAAERNHVSGVRSLLEAGADPNQTIRVTADKRAMYGLTYGHFGPEIDREVEWPGFTVLHFASGSGLTEIVKVLLQTPQIDLNGTSRATPSPLMLAGISGHRECFAMLLEAPAVDLGFRDASDHDVLDCCLVGVNFFEHSGDCLHRLLSEERFAATARLARCVVVGNRAFPPDDEVFQQLVASCS